MRILLFTGDRETARRFSAAARRSAHALFVAETAEETAERMFRDAFDALLLTDPGMLQSSWRRRPLNWPRRIYLIGKALDGLPDGLTFCFSADSDPEDLLLRVCALGSGRVRQTGCDALISGFLQRIGVPVSLSGFTYLAAGMRLLLKRRRLTDVNAIAELYEVVAAETGTDASKAEHAMRHAIDAAWMRADPATLMEVFGNTVQSERAAPSNAAFLFRAAEQVRFAQKGEEIQ